MAKLKAPLLSLGAAQQIGKSLVFFPWKGLNIVREYVVPANPNTAAQQTQRAYVTAAVAELHRLQAFSPSIFTALDITAYALWASVVKAATTWFNQLVKNWIDQNVAGLDGCVYCDGSVTPGANQLVCDCTAGVNAPTAANWHYGTSKTNMPNTQAAVPAAGYFPATIAGLTTGQKYYVQLRATAPAGSVGTRSGIYHGTPT